MKTKICKVCQQELDIECFSKKTEKYTQSRCKKCQSILSKQHYHDNKHKYLDRNIRTKDNLRSWYLEFKSKLKCERCSENHVACLQFHHIDRKLKIKTPSLFIVNNNKKGFLEEIKKCIVLCANCHAKEHYDNPDI